MNKKITIYYPIKKETPTILEMVYALGTAFKSRGIREVYASLTTQQLLSLEQALIAQNIPYNLIQYGDGLATPKVKRFRPNSCMKEINCCLFTGQEAGDEDGLIPVSRLLEIISSSDGLSLKKDLLEEIKLSSFIGDETEAFE